MQLPFKWGMALGAAILVWTAGVHLLGIYTTRIAHADLVDQIAIWIPLLVFTLALLEKRRSQAGALSLWQGITTGLLVGWVSVPLSAGGLWVYHHHVNPEWMDIIVQYQQQAMLAAGSTEAEIAARVAQLRAGASDRSQLVSALIGTTVLSLVLSFVITVILNIERRFALGRKRRTGSMDLPPG